MLLAGCSAAEANERFCGSGATSAWPAARKERRGGLVKRFYKSAEPVESGGGHQIRLDGRPVNTPAKARLVVPSAALAAALAEEWDAQAETVEPQTMPLTQLANTTIDQVSRQRDEVVTGVLAYAETDLLCYRADQPEALVQRQTATWQPFLDWAALEFDAPLSVTRGVLPARQPRSSLEAFTRVVGAFDDFRLAAVSHAAGLEGSIVLALALSAGRATAEESFRAAYLDDLYQQEVWGGDAEAAARLDRLRAEIAATERFLRLLEG